MFYRQRPINAVCSTVCLLTTLHYFAECTKIVYSFPAGGGGGGAKSSSSSSQFVGVVKKREDLPGFESDESSFGPIKGYSSPGGGGGSSSGGGGSYGGGGGSSGDGGTAYSVSSFSTGGNVAGFSTHIKHEVPRRDPGDSPSASAPYQRSSGSEPEHYFPSPAERPEPSRLFASFFGQEEPSAAPLSGDFREASESANDGKHLEEIRKHMEEAEKMAFDDESYSEGGDPSEGNFSPEGLRDKAEGDDEDEEEDGVGCKNCNYAQFQMEHGPPPTEGP